MAKIFKFEDLTDVDLVIDAIYEGGLFGNAGDDPITKLMNCGNQGGFRYKGSYESPAFCVLYSEMASTEWPDEIDFQKGLFTYFGDNKKAGHELHDTSKKGNQILKITYELLHENQRNKICPFFIFTKASGAGRSVVFRGIAVPGASNLNRSEDLIAIWKKAEDRFLNYKAIFTILDIQTIPRLWIKDLIAGIRDSKKEPEIFSKWKKGGVYRPLIAEAATLLKSKDQQLPKNKFEEVVIKRIIRFFKDEHPDKEYAFEKCAVEIAKMLQGIVTCDRTRPWKDGGRDATGIFRIGTTQSYTDVEFALEAKCKEIDIGSTVKETSRLIARIKHRQFGIFITTSYLADQAYKEILEDGHPILILTSTDIAEIVIKKLDLSQDKNEESLILLNNWLLLL
jgi:hypothetical protein